MAISVSPTFVITVPKADLTLIQTTPSEIRQLDSNTFRQWLANWSDSEDGMVCPFPFKHNTEYVIDGLTYARAIEIVPPYSITFEDGFYQVNIIGSNNNIHSRRNLNSVSLVPNNSAGLISASELVEGTQATKRLIESLRPHHKGYGDVWFWDPNNGSDINDGRTPAKAFQTFAAAHARAQDYGHDIIMIVPKGDNVTISYEPMIISKNFLFVRGMGYNAHLHPNTTTPGGNLIEISGNGVELSGIHLEGIHITDPNCNGIVVTGTHVLLENITVEECTGHGITVTTVVGHDDQAEVRSSHIRRNGKSGLQYNQGNHLELIDVEFEANGEHGVDCTGAGLSEDPLFHHCNFLRNTGYGLKLNNANVVGATIESECLFSFNGLGDYLNNGTDTIVQGLEESAGIAAAVRTELTTELARVDSSISSRLATAGYTAPDNAAVAAAVWAKALDGLTAEQIMKVTLAALAGKRSGLGTSTEVRYANNGTTPVITFTPADAFNNGTPTLTP